MEAKEACFMNRSRKSMVQKATCGVIFQCPKPILDRRIMKNGGRSMSDDWWWYHSKNWNEKVNHIKLTAMYRTNIINVRCGAVETTEYNPHSSFATAQCAKVCIPAKATIAAKFASPPRQPSQCSLRLHDENLLVMPASSTLSVNRPEASRGLLHAV